MAEARRISQILTKNAESAALGDPAPVGFHAELPGWDLATLLQMSCARRDRACVEVRCGESCGLIFMAEGRLLHATVGQVVGEAAVALMLDWPGGSFALCERAWPAQASIDESPDTVLLRAAQAKDEAARNELAHTAERARYVPARTQASALAPSESSAEPIARAEVSPQAGALIASVRIDMNGDLVAQNGSAEALAPLVAYVTRMGALLGPQLGLEAFEALSADLGKRRALVFVEGSEMVGLLLPPGQLYQELRQQLGV